MSYGAANNPGREAGGAMHPRAAEAVQARHQAGARPQASRELHGRAQGGVHQVEDQSQEGEEAGGEEMVLRGHPRVWSSRAGEPIKQPGTACSGMFIHLSQKHPE